MTEHEERVARWARAADMTPDQVERILAVRKKLGIDRPGIDSPGSMYDALADYHSGYTPSPGRDRGAGMSDAARARQQVSRTAQTFYFGVSADSLRNLEADLDAYATAIRAEERARWEPVVREAWELLDALAHADRFIPEDAETARQTAAHLNALLAESSVGEEG